MCGVYLFEYYTDMIHKECDIFLKNVIPAELCLKVSAPHLNSSYRYSHTQSLLSQRAE